MVITILATVTLFYSINYLGFIVSMIFLACVYFLEFLGDITFIGYAGINVVIFCILLPTYILYSVIELRKRKIQIRKLKEEIDSFNKKLES